MKGSETFPDGQYTIEVMIAKRDKVMMRGSFTGTHRGAFKGVPGTGKKVTMTWIVVLGIENRPNLPILRSLRRMDLYRVFRPQLGYTESSHD